MEEQAVEIGTLKDIVFARDGFLIGKFAYEQKRGVFTALGKIMRPERGLAYKLRGHWTDNPRFGRQLAFGYYEVLQPKDAEGIFKYLVRVAKWIGPTVAGRIVNAYGENSLEVLRCNPERVAAEIKGITLDRAKEIQACLAENEQIEAALVEIERLLAPVDNVPKDLAFEMVNRWGADAVPKLKENPYILTRLKGVGFLTADRIATALGFDSRAAEREAAAVLHVIGEAMAGEGHVWVPAEELRRRVAVLTGLAGEFGLKKLFDAGEVVEWNECYAQPEADEDESVVAHQIVKVLHGNWRTNTGIGESRMADIVDEANESMAMHINLRIEKARKTLSFGSGPSHSEDCGEIIPEGRRKALPGCTRCVQCQQQLEVLHSYIEPKHSVFIR